MKKNINFVWKKKMLTKEHLKRKNFGCDELFASDTAYRINNDNIKSNDFVNYPAKSIEQSILPCLMNTADMCQEFYDLLYNYLLESCGLAAVKGFYVKINSGYRCKTLNDLVGSWDGSQHLQGEAVDLICPAFGSPEKIIKFLFARGFVVDQCLMEGSWLHISRKLRDKNRMEYAYYLINPKTGKREKKLLKK